MSKDHHGLAIEIRRESSVTAGGGPATRAGEGDPATSATEGRLIGEIDLRNSPRLRAALLEIATGKPRRVILDLSSVSYVDSSGIGTIVEFKRRVDPTGEVLVLVGLQARVRGVLEITRLDHFFRIMDTVELAREA